MRRRTAMIVTTLAAIASIGIAGGAEAAVRRCAPMVVGAPRSASTETEARRQALAAWVEEARRLGEAFASWRLAATRSIVCQRRAAPAAFICSARAAPCGISQVPDGHPRGAPPPPLPGRKKGLIEA